MPLVSLGSDMNVEFAAKLDDSLTVESFNLVCVLVRGSIQSNQRIALIPFSTS
jgi:hypothetical protein